MININEQINKLEIKLGVDLPVDFRKFLQSKAKDQLIGKCFYDCQLWNYDGKAWPITITCIYKLDQLLKTKKEEIAKGYLPICIAEGDTIVIGINKENFGRIFIYKWVGFKKHFVNPSDVNYYQIEKIFSYNSIADNFEDFCRNLLSKPPIYYKVYYLSKEKIKEIKNLEGTARMQYLISMAPFC